MLATLAVALAAYAYFAGPAASGPVRLVPTLAPVALTLETLHLGTATLPVPVSGYLVRLTHDLAGPLAQGWLAAVLVGLLALGVAGWVAVVSTLQRTAFGVGMVPVIFLLMSLNADTLGVFDSDKRYFLYLLLGVLGGAAFGIHAFAEGMRLGRRWLVFGALVAGLGGVLYARSDYSALETTLQLAAFSTTGGAVLLAALVGWVGGENVRALLWFNTQADDPDRRFGRWPFLLGALSYLAALAALFWNGELRLLFGLRLDPLVLLLPAVLTGGLGLRLRAPSYQDWVPYPAARQLYALAVAVAATALAYAFQTDNSPLLDAARDYTTLALLVLGTAFLAYVLLNFGPLLGQRKQVFRVVFQPRRLPFYTVYIFSIGILLAVQVRNGFPWSNQVQAGEFNLLGDLTRLQSEAAPDDLGLGLLAERYYAESGDVLDRNNAHAQLGRAALYRFREQRQSEVVALRRAIRRQPDPRISLRLGQLFMAPQDLFDGLDALRAGLRDTPRSAELANDLAQRFTQTALTDSVAHYLDLAERLGPGRYAGRSNQLAFVMGQKLLPAAAKLAAADHPTPTEPALVSNILLLKLLQNHTPPPPNPADFQPLTDLDAAQFAALYHAALAAVQHHSAALLPALIRLGSRPANEPYADQLLFLQSLTHHALGHEMAARQLLAPLTAGTGPEAAYFRQTLARWQATQGQYATAAVQYAAAPAPDSALLAGLQGLARTRPAPPQPPVGTAWAQQAATAAPAAAARLYGRIVREAPFNETAVLAAAEFYARRRDFTAAYAALQAGLAENPTAPALLQAYALAAADAGLPDYAAPALEQLKTRLAPADFARLQADFVARHQRHAGFE